MNIPKRMAGQTPSHARAKIQEAGIAKRIGGRITPGSGSGDEKGDVRLKGFVRVEAKTTKNASFSITADILKKLDDATFGSGEVPILQVELCLGKYKIVVMPDWALDLVVDALKNRA